MASIAVGPLDPEPVLRLVRGTGMLNKYLAAICRAEGLQHTGVKVDLQTRINYLIKRYAASGDVEGYRRVKSMLEHPDQIQQPRAQPHYGSYAASSNVASPQGTAHSYNALPPQVYQAASNIQFKPSPFYTIQAQLGPTRKCDTMSAHRHTVSIQFKSMDYPILASVQTDKSLRVMLFGCEEDDGRAMYDIAFPHQTEVKVNGGEVKSNLRGIKNKPGSTRSLDITDFLRLRQTQYPNTIDFTYALTYKAGTTILQRYYLMVYVVKTVPVADLVQKLNGGKRISRESVIQEMVNKSRDPDVVATSTVLSLKCPLSYSRMILPCRSISCRHNQCFDATSYLQLQEQGPTWQCPICNIAAPFENLVVDDYVSDILVKTSRSIDQVTIEPDGKWSQHSKSDSSHGNRASFGSDNDDLVEIKDARISALKIASTPGPSINFTRTPPTSSREPSASVASPYGSTSSKRPISQVIDLTISDDEDEEPVSRAPKRQFTGYTTPQSMLPGRNEQSF